MRFTPRLLASTAATLLLAGTSAAQNIVSNPGFETGANNVGSPTSTITGWTLNDGGPYTGNPGTGCGDTENIGYSFNRHSGNYGLQFGGFECSDGISQALTTSVGTAYNIDFFVRNSAAANPGGELFSAFFGSNTIYNAYLAPTGLNYVHMTASFVATSTSTTLTFLSRNDDSYDFLDDITVSAAPNAVTTPEPSSLALLGTGIAGLVPMIRRRNRR